MFFPAGEKLTFPAVQYPFFLRPGKSPPESNNAGMFTALFLDPSTNSADRWGAPP
jgi:hypothetical protein